MAKEKTKGTKTENIKTENTKVEETKKEEIKGKVKTQKSVRKIVSRDMEVAIMNNTHGGFIYVCPKTQNRYEMSGYGDIDYITVGELLTMKNAHKAILEKFWILLIDIVSDEVELEDVLKYLGLDRIYDNILNPENIDGFIIKSKTEDYNNALKTMNKNIVERVIERSIMLFKEGKFNDFTKIQFMQEIVGNDQLFVVEKEE